MSDEQQALYFLYITAPDRDTAMKLASGLVEARLAACGNILGPIQSVYQWKGKIETEEETVLIAKTQRSLVDEATRWVKANHPYEVPCVVALPLDASCGNADFLDWIRAETRPRP